MNKLFVSIYLDEDVNVLLAEMLRNRGYDAVSTTETGMKGSSDRAQFEYAIENERAILTHNRVDFENLVQEYFSSHRKHYGVVISSRKPVKDILNNLLIVLNNYTSEEMQDQVIYI